MAGRKKANNIILSPALLSLERQIGEARRAIAELEKDIRAELKKDFRKIASWQKRKTGKNKPPFPFLEIMQKYAALEERMFEITRGILKNGR